jgi:dolichol-phosphate mannosyltransferase
VIVPTYNEIDNIGPVTRRILAASTDYDILIVDDNSPDGTGRLADELASASPRVSVLHRPGKSGLGAAYRDGFGWGLRAGYDFLVEMDAEGSHPPEQLPALIAGARHADVVIGSRSVPGGSPPNRALHRAVLSRAARLYVRAALALPFKDSTSGYRVVRASALRAVDYRSVQARGYCFQIEMLWRARRAELTILELPIDFTQRMSGSSKMSMGILVEALARVTLWGIGDLRSRVRRARALKTAITLLANGSASDSPQVHGGLAPAHAVDGRD